MHLTIDAAVTLLDLEEALVAPSVVPGVHAQPVISAVLVSPSDDLDSVATESAASGVLVDTGLVGREVLVDGEGSGDSSVLSDVSLDLIDVVDHAEAIALSGQVLVSAVINSGVARARRIALGSDLSNLFARLQGLRVDVVGALGHGVVVAEFVVAEVSSRNDTLPGEPFPGGCDLASVAAHGLALKEVAAAGGIRN